MNTVIKYATTFIIMISLLMSPLCAIAADKDILQLKKKKSAEVMAADAVIVRPLGIASMVAGFGLFLVSSPFSALGGNIDEAWESMVTDPAKFAFTRPLGDF